VKTWIDYGWIDDASRSLNRSRIAIFENIPGLDPDPDLKNFRTGAELESEKVTPATTNGYVNNVLFMRLIKPKII